MSIRYVVGRPDRDYETKPLPRRRAMRAIFKRIPRSGWYRLKLRGEGGFWARWKRRKFRRVVRRHLAAADPGDIFFAWGQGGWNEKVEIRAVDTRPKVELPAQSASWPVDQKNVYTEVIGNFKGVAWWGTCNCRDARGSSSLSDHACCRAGDFAPTSKAQGDEIYEHLMARKGKLGIRYISWCGNKHRTECTLHGDHLHVATGEPCTGCS